MDRDIDSIDLIQEKLGNPPKYQGDLIIRCIFCDVDFYSEKDAQNHDQNKQQRTFGNASFGRASEQIVLGYTQGLEGQFGTCRPQGLF